MAPQLEIVRQPAPPRGLFITLEGGEGSGKSSQAAILKALLEGKGYRVALTREPGGCELGRRVQDLLNDGSIDLDPRAELFLFEAARAQHVAEVILPALAPTTSLSATASATRASPIRATAAAWA